MNWLQPRAPCFQPRRLSVTAAMSADHDHIGVDLVGERPDSMNWVAREKMKWHLVRGQVGAIQQWRDRIPAFLVARHVGPTPTASVGAIFTTWRLAPAALASSCAPRSTFNDLSSESIAASTTRRWSRFITADPKVFTCYSPMMLQL